MSSTTGGGGSADGGLEHDAAHGHDGGRGTDAGSDASPPPPLDSGSKLPGRDFRGTVTKAQVREIAETKLKDMNAHDVEAAMLMIEGSARAMGIQVRE